jgi:drug/metabolite transporter (DMT)-like permease
LKTFLDQFNRTFWFPVFFIFIWATGYIAAKAAAPYADPLTFLSWRYVFIICLMMGLALVAKAPWPNLTSTLHLCVAGAGIQAIYLGGVWYAIAQGLPAGVAALIVNLQPVLTAGLAFTVNERLSGRQWLGVVLGFSGAALVITQRLFNSPSVLLETGSVLICVVALLGITLGTLYQKKFVPSFDLRTGQVIQFSASLALTLPFALWLEQGRMQWNSSLILAMLWSVVILTGAGISIMFYMLRNGLATKVTSTMYVVPGVTALIAWVLFNERLSWVALAGMALTLLGVWLVVKSTTPESKAVGQ